MGARGNSGVPGNSLTLFEYNSKWPELAEGLIKVLENSHQEVPDDLRKIAEEVATGERKVVDRNNVVKKPSKTQLREIKDAKRQYDSAGKPICKFFLEGFCTNGDWCQFS